MQDNWFIKLHRKLLDNPIATNPLLIWLFCYLLLLVSYKDHIFFLWKIKIEQKRGEAIISKKDIAKWFGISRATLSSYLSILHSEHIIDIKSTNKYTVLTIVNRDKYQTTDIKLTSTWHQLEHQPDTINKDKNIKEEYITELEDVIKQRNWQPEFLKLPKTIKTTQAIKDTRCTRRQEYTLEEVKMSINAYLINIKNRVDDGKWFFHHRFTFYDFIKQSNWLQKFINNQPQW